ncbi:MAG: hypothetical protein R3B96_08600 [Pirellulaceae bacterium]
MARYGTSDEKFQRDGAPKMIENFCVARRLVEAGAVCRVELQSLGLAWRRRSQFPGVRARKCRSSIKACPP